MSRADSDVDELGRLTAALCDGEITTDEARRLEELAGSSPAARRFFLEYLELHGELYWDHAAGAGTDLVAQLGPPPSPSERARQSRRAGRGRPGPRFWLLLGTLAASLALAVVGWRAIPRGAAPVLPPSAETSSSYAARITAAAEPRWSGGAAERPRPAQLQAGQELRLAEGLVEVSFARGGQIILAAPAEFYVDGADQGFLLAGSLVAHSPGTARLAMRTPLAVISATGAEWGIRVERGGTVEVESFAGTVEVRDQIAANGAATAQVEPGRAVRISRPAPDQPLAVEKVAAGRGAFVRRMPPQASLPGSVAAMRELVARHANLIHHYTFEGTTREEKCLDKQGGLHLMEVVMSGGRGKSTLDYAGPGVDDTTDAIETFRAAENGDAAGVALQSEHRFQPPAAMTVELLQRLGEMGGAADAVAAAIATRDSGRHCGFFVAAAGAGTLVHLFDGDAPWTEAALDLAPGDWYYVASTFQVRDGQTIVNTYAANVTRGETRLARVVTDQTAPGTPAASRLGIGKGFDGVLAHAYPWPGRLDEIAIYDAALDETTLQQHLDALMRAR